MHDQASLFLRTLFATCTTGYLTLSAIHPDGKHATPSRHISVQNEKGLSLALSDLFQANEQGWGAFLSVATRQTNLGRWRRGGSTDLLELPALFVDLDVPVVEAIQRLRAHDPPPSCVVASGGGVHAYWFLEQPTSDWDQATRALQRLRQRLGSDKSSVVQALRVPGSLNSKPQRHQALCHILDLQPNRYPLTRFIGDISTKVRQTNPRFAVSPAAFEFKPHSTLARHPGHSHRMDHSHSLNPRLIAVIEVALIRDYEGYRQLNGWLAARCPCGHHRDAAGMHFAFNPEKGIGVCLGRHGQLLVHDLCYRFHIDPSDYGGIYTR